MVSSCLTRSTGSLTCTRCDREGSGLFSPQSPRANELFVVAMAWCVGYGSVAVSEARVMPAPDVSLTLGRGSGFGSEKRRELRRRLAVGESDCRRRAMAMRQPRARQWRLKWWCGGDGQNVEVQTAVLALAPPRPSLCSDGWNGSLMDMAYSGEDE
jgi:hypothetical protein